MKLLKSLLFFIFSSAVLAETVPLDATLFKIKLSSEHAQSRELHVTLQAPETISYSYYHGSDLPTWKRHTPSTIAKKLKSGQLLTIQVQQNQQQDLKQKELKKDAKQKTQALTVYLSLDDPKNLRPIWHGALQYDPSKTELLKITSEYNDEKHYDNKISFNKENKTFWLDTSDRS